MAKLKPSEIVAHRAFLRRQEVQEAKYTPKFYRYLKSVYDTAANQIEKGGVDSYLAIMAESMHETKLISIYYQLYRSTIMTEAIQQRNELLGEYKPEKGRKDIIDDLSTPFTDGNIIKLWRSLTESYLRVRITSRITNVNSTTAKAISKVIEKAISDGVGALETARRVREQTQFNKVRSLAIARTETVSAANQGKYMAALSNELVLEKNWVPTRDDRTRPTHLAMLDHPWIDLDQFFMLDSRKNGIEPGRYPCDGTYSAENVVNCRCSVIFRAKRDKTGNLIRRM